MSLLIKNAVGYRIITQSCQHLTNDDPLPDSDISVPLARWQEQVEQLRFHPHRVGVRLAPKDSVAELLPHLSQLSQVVVTFPSFTDGRGYSQARRLREFHDFSGEIRASGEVLRDQLAFMVRCGIDAFELAAGQDPHEILAALNEISVTYQPAADGRGPIWRYRTASRG